MHNVLEYCHERGDYYVDDWLAAVVVGPKALLQKRIGKKVACATLYKGRITPVVTGTVDTLAGLKWRAASTGWVEN